MSFHHSQLFQVLQDMGIPTETPEPAVKMEVAEVAIKVEAAKPVKIQTPAAAKATANTDQTEAAEVCAIEQHLQVLAE